MATLTAGQVYTLAKNAGLSPAAAVIATAIAKGESGWRTDAMGDTTITNGTWGPSVGLWQIRSLKADYGTGRTRDAARLTDPAFNARSMVAISSQGTNWRPWTIFTNGAYRQHLATAQAAAAAGGEPVPADLGAGSGGILKGTLVEGEGLLDRLNPFDSWAEDGLELGVKLLATTVAGALVVVGVIRTVSGGSS